MFARFIIRFRGVQFRQKINGLTRLNVKLELFKEFVFKQCQSLFDRELYLILCW